MRASRSHLAQLSVPAGKTFIIVQRRSIGMKCTAEKIDHRALRGQKKMGQDNANERSDAAAPSPLHFGGLATNQYVDNKGGGGHSFRCETWPECVHLEQSRT